MILNEKIFDIYLCSFMMMVAIMCFIVGEASWKGGTISGSMARLFAVVFGFYATYIYRKSVAKSHWTKSVSIGTAVLLLEIIFLALCLTDLIPIPITWNKLMLLGALATWPIVQKIVRDIENINNIEK